MRYTLLIIGIFSLYGLSCDKEIPDTECKWRSFYVNTALATYQEVFYYGMVSFYDYVPGDTIELILEKWKKLYYIRDTILHNIQLREIAVLIDTKNCFETDQLFAQIKKDPRVSNCSKAMIYRYDLHLVSDRFYCKLKSDLDIEKMYELIEETRTRFMGAFDNDPGKYIIVADKFSKGDAIDLSKEFYESGYFSYSYPNIYFFKYKK